jgi:hypothetical protein
MIHWSSKEVDNNRVRNANTSLVFVISHPLETRSLNARERDREKIRISSSTNERWNCFLSEINKSDNDRCVHRKNKQKNVRLIDDEIKE